MAEAGFEKALETARHSGRGFPRRKRLCCHSVGIGHSAGDPVADDRLGAMETMGQRPILATALCREVMGARDPYLRLFRGAGRDIFGRGSLDGNLLSVGILWERLSLSPPLGFRALLVFSCHLFPALLEGGPST